MTFGEIAAYLVIFALVLIAGVVIGGVGALYLLVFLT
jgi:hypothetical protein